MSAIDTPGLTLRQQSALRLCVLIGTAMAGTREAPWYGAFTEVLQFFLAMVVVNKFYTDVTTTMPQYPLLVNVDLRQDEDMSQSEGDVSLPPSPTPNRGTGQVLGSSEQPPKHYNISFCIPDFTRLRTVLQSSNLFSKVLAHRVDLLVENKGLVLPTELENVLVNAFSQCCHQAEYAFGQDPKINVIAMIISAGPYWRYHEIRRSEMPARSLVLGFGGDRDYVPPIRLDHEANDHDAHDHDAHAHEQDALDEGRLVLFGKPRNAQAQTPPHNTPNRLPHSRPSGSSGPPRKRKNMAIFDGSESDAQFTNDKPSSPLIPVSHPLGTFPPGVEPSLHEFETELETEFGASVGPDNIVVFDLRAKHHMVAEVFTRIASRLLVFDPEWDEEVAALAAVAHQEASEATDTQGALPDSGL
ncbi:hypothetical protein HGRIS_010136 [Hohenbuehelia grisea]|uniref:Uncharacterized protein n=1 Tax=Hohenbuehelia grisea TaxID=104357 RepID=A0ABR3J4U7_9AGAR